jgi:hypothetical protein
MLASMAWYVRALVVAKWRPLSNTIHAMLAIALAGALPACGGSTPASSGGGPGCPEGAGNTLPGSVPLRGGVTGPNISGQICTNGSFAVVESLAGTGATDPFAITLGTSPSASSAAGNSWIVFQSPEGATSGEAEAVIGLNAASPGTYSSADGACAYVIVCADMPYTSNPPPVCGDGGTCVPTQALSQCYQAQGPTSCDGEKSATTVIGSWSLTLTSVAPGVEDSAIGTLDQTAHGSLTATLVADDPRLGGATLSVTF